MSRNSIIAIIVVLIAIITVGAYALNRKSATPQKTPGTSSNPTTSTKPASSSTVKIANFAFNPKEITIKMGEEVTFTNENSADHTATSDTGIFESGNLAKGESFKFKFDNAGTYNYHCNIHPSMKGSVIVK